VLLKYGFGLPKQDIDARKVVFDALRVAVLPWEFDILPLKHQ